MSLVPWPALPSTVRAGSRELTLQLPPPPPALFSFEAGGEGGAAAGAGSGGFLATSECPFLLEPMPTLDWPTGPQKALPVSLATPTPPPCSALYQRADRAGARQAPWMTGVQCKMDRQIVAGRMQGGPCVPSPASWGGTALPTVLLHLQQGSPPGVFLPSSPLQS